MDNKSSVAESRVNTTANRLYEHYIDVIPVAIGEETDSMQLMLTTKDQSNLIEAPKVFVPGKLGEAIMRKVLKGILLLHLRKIRALNTSLRVHDFSFTSNMLKNKKSPRLWPDGLIFHVKILYLNILKTAFLSCVVL